MINPNKLLLAVNLFICSAASGQIITTYAGDGTFSVDTASCPADGGQATATTINSSLALRTDATGNVYYSTYGPYWNCIHIKKISASGLLTNFAGNGTWMTHSGDGGPAASAGFFGLNNFCLDNAGNMYILENGVNVSWIRKVNTAGIVSTIAGGDSSVYSGDGGPATAAGFDGFDIATDASGNIYFTDRGNSRIRKINSSGIITTIAGTGTFGNSGDGGPATAAELDLPGFITLDASGNIYFTDQPPSTVIRKITPAGIISTVANATELPFENAGGMACDNTGNLYVSDVQHNVIKKINSSGVVSTFAGTTNLGGYAGDGGPAIAATLYSPEGIAIDGAGNLYIGDVGNYRVRKVWSTKTGINPVIADEHVLRIWPEPNDGTFNIAVPSVVNETAQVTISNTLGQKVKELTVATNQDVSVQLTAPAGMYFINVTTGEKRLSSKMVIR